MAARLALLCALAWALVWAPLAGAGEPIVLREYLILSPITGGGRVAFAYNPVFRHWLLPEPTPSPRAGQRVQLLKDGRGAAWKRVVANDKGVLTAREARNGLTYCEITREAAGVMVLEGRRYAWARINDDWYAGDPYGNGAVRSPVALKAGVNRVWLRPVRGNMTVRLVDPVGAAELNERDRILPDLRLGRPAREHGSLPVINTTNAPLEGVTLTVGDDVVVARHTVRVATLAPLGVLQVPFPVRTVEGWTVATDAKTVEVPLVLRWPGGEQASKLTLRVRQPNQVYKASYLSSVDGSAQYYAINPPAEARSGPVRDRVALVLSLHGAGVQASGQARAYGQKDWAVIVAPTNRRPFGFDWEDWGRVDALEVLADARKRYPVDPTRVYLTGHSMGGHGTWQLGVNHPDRWAAIGPSAGWGSFWDYGTREDTSEAAQLFNRAVGSSRTNALLPNLAPLGVYLIHGTADRNVPAALGKRMLERLAPFHKDVQSHFQPGAGHWWGGKMARGADCVDWPGMWHFFRRRTIDPRPAKIDFRTADLSVSHRCHWVELRTQTTQCALSRLVAEVRPDHYRFETTNLERFRFTPTGFAAVGDTLTVEVDGARATVVWRGGAIEVARDATDRKAWTLGPPVDPGHARHPGRTGPFKRAFANRFVLVYGTGGTAEEAAATLARARYDAGVWGYRAAGRALLVADTDYDPVRFAGRNLILYGNATSNHIWAALSARWPLKVAAGSATLGDRTWKGGGLAVLACMPHPTDRGVLVGLVGATGQQGLRASHSVRYFVSGVGYPDVTIFDAAAMEQGLPGVTAHGFMGPTWGIEGAEIRAR